MSNEFKRNEQPPGVHVPSGVGNPVLARVGLLTCLAVLAGLITQLPGPVDIVAVVTGAPSRHVDSTAPLATIQSILLTTAGIGVWLLVLWAAVVLVVGVIARLPGLPGRRAGRLLRRIAPATVGRLVATAVGVSLIAGTSACAAPTAAGSGATATGATPIPTTFSAPETVGATTPSEPTPNGVSAASITIDWPDARSDPPASGAAASTPANPPTLEVGAPESPTASGPAAPTLTPPAPMVPRAPVPVVPQAVEDPTPDPAPADSTPGTGHSVTVAPDDTLWRIAAAALGPEATDADIDNAWRAWYVANQEVVGDDPDLIVPGQVLSIPDLRARS